MILIPIIMLAVIYLIIAWINHYELIFGKYQIPMWMCVFCLTDKLFKKKKIKKVLCK
jgi:hypothetical protein